MAPKPKVPQQYFEYVNYITKHNSDLSIKPVDYYLKKIKLLSSVFQSLPTVVYLLDYRGPRYLYLSENCEQLLGYTHKEIMERGQQWHIRHNFHPEDLSVFSSDIFIKFLEHTRTFKKSELQDMRFSVNFRCKRKDDVYIHALQQYSILETDEAGFPILTLGTWTDITVHKTNSKMVFAVSKYDKKKGFSFITTDTYPLTVNITSREKQIIKAISEGLSSKQIAEKLHISLYTVNAHRQNISQKTNCKNTAELINYAQRFDLT